MSIEFHRRMLADSVRHDAFRAALAHTIRPGRSTVADIGAGTGVFSLPFGTAVKPGGKIGRASCRERVSLTV